MSLFSTNTHVNEYKVFKIIDTENGYYKYIISEIDDTEMNLEHFEHYCGVFPEENDVTKYFNIVADWDMVEIEEETFLKAIDILNNSFIADEKCMNKFNKFKELAKAAEEIEKEKALKAAKKAKVPKEKKEAKPKAEPKPKSKKSDGKVTIEMNPPPVVMN